MEMNTTPSPETTASPSEPEKNKPEKSRNGNKGLQKDTFMQVLRLLGLGIIIVAVLGLLIWIGERQDSGVNQPSPIGGDVTAIDHVEGPDTAQLTLIEYADFQCPTCAAYAPVLDQLHTDYPDSLRIVYRYFPLQSIHPNATAAAEAAEAADKQGKFWEYHDLLFENQSEWSSISQPRDTFVQYAQDLGLDTHQFQTDLDSKDVKSRVQADYRSGLAAGVNGTPTFYLNGQPLENPRGLDAFKAVLDEQLQQ